LMLNIFLLLAGYYLLKTIREPLILTVPGGAEVKSYAAAAIAGLLIVLVPIYSAVASRVSRVKLINGVTLFFIACLLAFFALSRAGVPVGVAFFIWVGIFNLMIIAQLWAFANDVYTVDQGKRLFAIVGFGASLGAIAGSFVTGQLVKQYGPYPFMLGAAALLAVCMVLTNAINAREKRRVDGAPPTAGDRAAAAGAPAAEPATEQSMKGRSGFALVFADPYLLLIAGLMLVYNLVNTNGEYILGKTVVGLYTATHGAAAAGGLDYSLQNTTRNALYLPTSREAKYKAKQANDTFFVRFGDVLSAGLVFAGTTWLGFAPRHFALVNVGLILVWIVLAVAIGRRFRQLARSD
jgi:ATP:ADP antiporter, AAA family